MTRESSRSRPGVWIATFLAASTIIAFLRVTDAINSSTGFILFAAACCLLVGYSRSLSRKRGAAGWAVSRGVEVRVLIDDVSDRFSWSSAAKALRRAGVPVGIFNPPFIPARLHAIHLRNHRKILVIDGAVAFTGGLNIDRTYWGEGASRDLHFRIRGPVVAQLMEVFAEDWHFAAGEALQGERWFPGILGHGDSLARAIEAGPDESIGRLRWAILGGLNAARALRRAGTPSARLPPALTSVLSILFLTARMIRILSGTATGCASSLASILIILR